MNIDSQRHHRAADVEIVSEGEDCHKQITQLKSHVVKELHCLILNKKRLVKSKQREQSINSYLLCE